MNQYQRQIWRSNVKEKAREILSSSAGLSHQALFKILVKYFPDLKPSGLGQMLKINSWNYFENRNGRWYSSADPILEWNTYQSLNKLRDEYTEVKSETCGWKSIDAPLGEDGFELHEILHDEDSDGEVVGRY